MKINSRKEFPNLLRNFNLRYIGVEVGVHRGNFSHYLNNNYSFQSFYLVDSWQHGENARFDKSNVSQLEHDENYHFVKERFKNDKNIHVIKQFSHIAAESFKDNSIDFVYIDAAHDFHSVTQDLKSWYSKVKIGGIIAGHDYKNSFIRGNLVQVKSAVDRFFENYGKKVLTTDSDGLESWWIKKFPL